jgi:hypothetical protein
MMSHENSTNRNIKALPYMFGSLTQATIRIVYVIQAFLCSLPTAGQEKVSASPKLARHWTVQGKLGF